MSDNRKPTQIKSDVLKQLVYLLECQQKSIAATFDLLNEMRMKQKELDAEYPEPAKMRMIRNNNP